MKKISSWEVSDNFWDQVEPLIPKQERNPKKKYQRKSGGGRKALDSRKVFSGILYVLRTGIQWKALPKEKFGAASAIHRYFQEWQKQGFFTKLWEKGLLAYDEKKGISWEWQSIDGSSVKAPLGKEAVGKNPTDRGKKWDKKKFIGRRTRSAALARH